eukprot:CAMPEP_0206619488 /NCGR_PEP_ID=MMETSP0325_2-20121206/60858_1 /ASSEMBLY_ACC=CAM_ASM_000347 /TAXON_ID=2866 /ORGANISM="Crypthecodinium cohnii, Strain Seligo" /LENGTH=54 /DNA_ID=CAMNT_0054141867 /DNA_START=11 /DNA_END=175 /DNA_ORIENTATION=-
MDFVSQWTYENNLVKSTKSSESKKTPQSNCCMRQIFSKRAKAPVEAFWCERKKR